MTDTDQSLTAAHRGQDIVIDGVIWRPRHRIARENIGCSDKTLKRRNPKTALIAGMAYCPVDEALTVLIADARRPNQPTTTKPTRKRSAR